MNLFNKNVTKNKQYVYVIAMVVLILAASYYFYSRQQTPLIKIGHFHGGHSYILYRTYINNYFEREGVDVNFITRSISDKNFHIVPKSYDEISDIKLYGKVTGEELIEKMIEGDFDGAVAGESSFIKAAAQGLPIVAVARLGYDTKNNPGHAIIFRKDVVINKSEDIKGKIMASRRSGPGGDKIFLREFLKSEGLDPEKDVTIIDNIPKNDLDASIINKSVDGAFYHINSLIPMIRDDEIYVYKTMDWMNPELSQAFLVFRKDFVEKHPDTIKKIVMAYMKRINFEHSLPQEERTISSVRNFKSSALNIEIDFMGMNLPQSDMPPLIDITLLNEMQELLYEYNFIEQKTDLDEFIDNSFVEIVYRELE